MVSTQRQNDLRDYENLLNMIGHICRVLILTVLISSACREDQFVFFTFHVTKFTEHPSLVSFFIRTFDSLESPKVP